MSSKAERKTRKRERRVTPTQRALKPKEDDGVVRALGLGLITGAADDDPSAIGTYAAAGAKLGPAFL
jgi:hypothetical protein